MKESHGQNPNPVASEPLDDKKSSLLEVFAVYAEETDESARSATPILDSWSLVSLNSTNIELALNFPDPLNVSSGAKPDLLLV